MFEEEFPFKLPDLDLSFKEIDDVAVDKNTITKINEYLDNDIREQEVLVRKLLEFEKKLDGWGLK